MSKILLVDASPLLYQVFETVGHLSTRGGEKTGTRFGFLRGVRSWKKAVGAEKVVVVYDSPGKINKAEGFADYKSNRVMTPRKEEMYGQLQGVKDLVSLTSWSQAEAPGYEADDILGTLARRFDSQGVEVCIATADKDLLSAVSPRVTVLLTGKAGKDKKKTQLVYDEPRVCAETGVMPALLPYKKALFGDKSDAVPPIMFLRKLLTESVVAEILMGLLARPKEKWEGVICENLLLPDPLSVDMLKQRIKLMDLQEVPELTLTKGAGNQQKLEEAFERLEFKSLLKTVEDFL